MGVNGCEEVGEVGKRAQHVVWCGGGGRHEEVSMWVADGGWRQPQVIVFLFLLSYSAE